MSNILPGWAGQMNRLGAERIPFLFVIDFDQNEPLVIPLSEISDACIRYEINPEIIQSGNERNPNENMAMEMTPVDFEVYQQGFQRVLKAILAGDTYLLNLCYSTRLAHLPSLEYIYKHAVAPFKLLFQNKFVVFSPERFVSIEDGIIRTFPMKGTIDASFPDAANILLSNVKEQEEHATVVDLLRNDLSIVSDQVTVGRYRYVSEITTPDKKLLQCSSEISGRLKQDYLKNLGSIIHALLPAGSVTGAPKKRTVELIDDIELEPRGYYTGVFGEFDGRKLDSAVMIRMIEQRPDGFYYRSGGGITYRSNVREEYEEMINKVYMPF